jgi:hypothetical protein
MAFIDFSIHLCLFLSSAVPFCYYLLSFSTSVLHKFQVFFKTNIHLIALLEFLLCCIRIRISRMRFLDHIPPFTSSCRCSFVLKELHRTVYSSVLASEFILTFWLLHLRVDSDVSWRWQQKPLHRAYRWLVLLPLSLWSIILVDRWLVARIKHRVFGRRQYWRVCDRRHLQRRNVSLLLLRIVMFPFFHSGIPWLSLGEIDIVVVLMQRWRPALIHFFILLIFGVQFGFFGWPFKVERVLCFIAFLLCILLEQILRRSGALSHCLWSTLLC